MVVTVSQILRRLSLLVKGDRDIQRISVKGEISNFTNHIQSGHLYFTLREGNAGIKAVMFRNYAERLTFAPEVGMNVVVTGSIQLYERDGACQVYVTEMHQDDGIGEGLLSFEQLKAKLNEEGLFLQKRPLPPSPSSICVVTSETGAAIKDITNVLSRRCPFVRVLLVPVLVQGTDAPASIAKGIEKAQSSGCDLIIFGRGGGSAEDLSAFNTEIVARAVYASQIPTISAVGHEIDFTIADFVADQRAPTPSAAAELAVPDMGELKAGLENLQKQLKEKVLNRLAEAKARLDAAEKLLSLQKPSILLETKSRRLKELTSSIQKDYSAIISRKESRLAGTVELLEAFSPLGTLERGYSMVMKDGNLVSSVKSVEKGERITVKLSDGDLEAVVESISPTSPLFKGAKI